MDDIVIRKMKTRDEVKGLDIDKRLPQPNFRTLMIAPSYVGKTNLILNLLIDHYKDMKVYIFSKSFKNDSIWDNIDIDEEFVFDTFDEPAIREILKEQEGLKQKHKNDLTKIPKLLFIIDDMVSDIVDSRSNIILELFFRGRHYVLSTILTSQAYKGLPSKIRLNGSDIILFPQSSETEVDAIAQENAYGGMSKKHFTKLFNHATTYEDFSFMYINRRAPLGQKFRRKFDTIINVEGDSIIEERVNDRLRVESVKEISDDSGEDADNDFEPVAINKKSNKTKKVKKTKKTRKEEQENKILDALIKRNNNLDKTIFG